MEVRSINDDGKMSDDVVEPNTGEVLQPSGDAGMRQIECEKAVTSGANECADVPPSVVRNNEHFQNKNECTFKRGGKCEIHGVIGTKYKVTRKVWTELKTGIHGWKTSQVTKYRCRVGNMERQVTRDDTAQNTESGIRKQALGRADEFPGTDLRISGRSNYGAGALK